MLDKLRNIAIIAHVDYGKTTFIDQLLHQPDTLDEHIQLVDEHVMDSNAWRRNPALLLPQKQQLSNGVILSIL